MDLRTKDAHYSQKRFGTSPSTGDASDVKQPTGRSTTSRPHSHESRRQRNFRRRLDVAFCHSEMRTSSIAVDDTHLLTRIQKRKVTWGQQVQNPAVSADGQWLLFNKLAQITSTAHSTHEPTGHLDRFDCPNAPKSCPPQTYSTSIDIPPYRKMAPTTFVRSDRNGGWDLWLLDVRRGHSTPCRRRRRKRPPTFTRRSFYRYTSQTGVFNLYSLDLERRATTDVTGGAFCLMFLRQTVVYGGFASGMDVLPSILAIIQAMICQASRLFTKIENRSSANGAAT